MAPPRKIVITCAVTGSIHTPTMSPHLPITPREIADAAVGAAEAGAAIVHLHARDPVDGRPTQDPKWFREFAPDIARRSNVVLNFTTGGAATMTIDERLQPALALKPEVASLNMGSMNFGLYPMLARYPELKHAWEREYLAGSEDRIFKNTFADIAHILRSCAQNGTRFEVECYDIGHLYTAAHFLERGLLKPLFRKSRGIDEPSVFFAMNDKALGFETPKHDAHSRVAERIRERILKLGGTRLFQRIESFE